MFGCVCAGEVIAAAYYLHSGLVTKHLLYGLLADAGGDASGAWAHVPRCARRRHRHAAMLRAAASGGPSLLPYIVIDGARDSGTLDAADAAMARAAGAGGGAWFVKATATNNALGVRASATLDVDTRAWMKTAEAGVCLCMFVWPLRLRRASRSRSGREGEARRRVWWAHRVGGPAGGGATAPHGRAEVSPARERARCGCAACVRAPSCRLPRRDRGVRRAPARVRHNV